MNELRQPGERMIPPLPSRLVLPGAVPTLDLDFIPEVKLCGPTKFSDVVFPDGGSIPGVI